MWAVCTHMFDLYVTPITLIKINILHLIENDLVDTQFLTCVPNVSNRILILALTLTASR